MVKKKNPDATKKEYDQKLKELLNKMEPYSDKSTKRKNLIDETNKLRNRVLDGDQLGDNLTEEEKKKKY